MTVNLDKAEGLLMAYDLVIALHDEIEREHHNTRSFFGFPTAEHHRLVGGSRALKKLAKRIHKARREQLVP